MPASAGSGRPTNPSNPTNPVVKPSNPVVQPASGGDQTWKGRRLRLILEDTFDSSLDLSKWEHEVTLSGGGVSVSTSSSWSASDLNNYDM